MAQVKYYPIKPKKQRVQFSADELKILCQVVREKIVAMREPSDPYSMMDVLYMKLIRAHYRLSA